MTGLLPLWWLHPTPHQELIGLTLLVLWNAPDWCQKLLTLGERLRLYRTRQTPRPRLRRKRSDRDN